IAGGELDDVIGAEDLAHQFESTAVVHPGVLLAVIETEGDCGIEGEGRILADVVVARRLPAFHGTVLDGIEHLKAWYNLAGGKCPNLELIIRRRRDPLGDDAGALE